MVIAEVNTAGGILGGQPVASERTDSTCVDAAASVAAAEGLVSNGVNAIMGADSSGATSAVLTNVAVPKGIGMISPSAMSPGHSNVKANGLFFRTSPSAACQGNVMTKILSERGIDKVALAYTNNDYREGLAVSFRLAFTETGGTVSITVPHEDSKADYSAEVAMLAGGPLQWGRINMA